MLRRLGPRRLGRRTARTTPTSAGWRRARCRPTRPRSPRKACGSRRSRLDHDMAARIASASRTPVERRGDLDAQRGANRLGVDRMAEVVGALGSTDALTEIVDYGERRMRAALARIPRRPWRVDDVLDSGGPASRAADADARSRSRSRSTATNAAFDFTGTDAQRAGQRQRGRSGDGERGRVRHAYRDGPDDAGERWRDAAGARDRASRAPWLRQCRRSRSAPATSRSASASPTSAWRRSRRRRRIGSVPRARAR